VSFDQPGLLHENRFLRARASARPKAAANGTASGATQLICPSGKQERLACVACPTFAPDRKLLYFQFANAGWSEAMPEPDDVSKHYAQRDITEAIRAGLATLGKHADTVTVEDLAPVDEFHIGGRKASADFLDQLSFNDQTGVLDVGCGLGGPARFVASRYGSQVTGIDLTPEYVETGNTLCKWVGLAERIFLHQGSALAMPFTDASFDGAYMMHVGMNIEDKEKLAHEVARVLRPGSVFGIYDVMRTGPGELAFPVPWATTANLSAVADVDRYKDALKKAGFTIVSERSRREFAIAFFEEFRARMAAAGGPPPLGLHVLMGKNSPEKSQNMIGNITAGRIAPVELIARKG
jgi:ubiquinone/menaquinone biosynthesis C-methylase UbiE